MSADLFRQVRRVEAQAERGFEGTAAEGAERRRRLRLELLRQHLAQNVDFLKAAHLGGASGQQSVQAYAAFMDGFLSTLFRLAVDDAKKEGAVPGPIVLVALGDRRPAALPALPPRARRERLPEGFRPVPGDGAHRA